MDILEKVTPKVYSFIKRHPFLIQPVKGALVGMQHIRSVVLNVFHLGESLIAPYASCHDTGEWIRGFTRSGATLSASIKYLHGAETYRRTVPGYLGNELFWKFSINLEFDLPPTFVAEIPEARVLDDGFVITPDHQILEDVSIINNPKSSRHPAFDDGAVGPVRRIKGTTAVLAAYVGRGYYHWMIDVLPRLELIRLAGYNVEVIDQFIVNCYVTSYQIETLKLLGIPRDKLVLTQSNPHLSVERLILPSLTNVYQTVPRWSCDFLNGKFLDQGHPKAERVRRIYISRGSASRRRVTNEANLMKLLSRRGFEMVVLEDMEISKQAGLFQSASVVIGPHGAGLTNWVFCDAGTQVVEIIHPESINLMFWTIASHRQLDYNYLFAKGDLPQVGEERSLNSEDMEVDLKEMELLLDQMEVFGS